MDFPLPNFILVAKFYQHGDWLCNYKKSKVKDGLSLTEKTWEFKKMRKWSPPAHGTFLSTWTAHFPLFNIIWYPRLLSKVPPTGQQHFKLRKMKKVCWKEGKKPRVQPMRFFQCWFRFHISSWLSGDVLWQKGVFVSSQNRPNFFSLVTCLARASWLL